MIVEQHINYESRLHIIVWFNVFEKCSNLWIQGVTILAPVDVPNTDGINPGVCCFRIAT